MKQITHQQLVQLNACVSQLEVFKRLFGDAVTPTVAIAKKYGHLLDADWAATMLLPSGQRGQYYEAMAPLWKQYLEARAPLWKQYEEAKARLDKQYYKAMAPLLKQYKQQCMVEFVKLYQQEN